MTTDQFLGTSEWAVIVPYGICVLAYAALTALILLQARRSPTGYLLAAASAATAVWAAASVFDKSPVGEIASAFDLLRTLAWYGFCLHLYRRALGASGHQTLFVSIGVTGMVGGIVAIWLGQAGPTGVVSLTSPGVLVPLTFGICQLLLLENLCRGARPDHRWHVGMACIALGGLAAYDVILSADAALVRAASPILVEGRALVAVLVTPLLALAAARNRNWRVNIHVSRTAAFHTATLMVSGIFLLSLAVAGELARRRGTSFGASWGSLVEVCLLFAGIITVLTLLTSASARGTLRRVLVDHFFTHRYDYRREWQRCIDALSNVRSGPLSTRVIGALADAVDSPAGLLFTREPGQAEFAWKGALNTSPTTALPQAGPLMAALLASDGAMVLDAELSRSAAADLFGTLFNPWLAVPLHDSSSQGAGVIGYILLAKPRTTFQLDAEVFDLLRILAHEVAIHLAQEQAATLLLQTRDLRSYGERFAFVAHDVKNVSSQLTLLLSNAETYLEDPDFQRDMLATVRASVNRIGGLIRRLEPACDVPVKAPVAVSCLDTAMLLRELVESRRKLGDIRFLFETNAASYLATPVDSQRAQACVRMEKADFEAAVTHLLDNAAAAVGQEGSVRVRLQTLGNRVTIDIVDDGCGMTAEFIRDDLFTPFSTRTEGGSGLGAFQARTLLRAVGGDLTAMSQLGCGTTMHLSLPLATLPDAPPAGKAQGVWNHDNDQDCMTATPV